MTQMNMSASTNRYPDGRGWTEPGGPQNMTRLSIGFLPVMAALLAVTAIYMRANAQTTAASSRHATEMNERGEGVMGFSQTKTTHHFFLSRDGGVIQVEAKDPSDATSRDEIREHLAHIAKMFSLGDFNAPMLIHAQVPPGVPEMKRLKAEINYKYEQTERGGQVNISTSEPQAIAAIHDFLRFQIREHRTGDPMKVPD